ncbi:MAG: hypothetical protein K2X99_12130 [Gemmatimonadaceae bacterium]|nr:hypothetical protein [Gemmatimonadaceae bacterium]
MPPASLPSLPWQFTGNHWIALPCVHPADGAVHAIGLLHRGARGAVEFAGSADFQAGTGPALARPTLRVDGAEVALAREGIAWERALHWLPTFTATVGELLVRGTVFAPYGRDADIAGAVYAIAVENRGSSAREVTLSLEGVLGHRQLRIRTPRPGDDRHVAFHAPNDAVVLEGAEAPGLAALAIGGESVDAVEVTGGDAPTFALRRKLVVPPKGRAEVAFYLAAGAERDGALATLEVLRRRGWRTLLASTRDALQALEQLTGVDALDGLLNRNLLFAYFYAVGRALDDAHFYIVRSRAPWHPEGVTVREWEALSWVIPAVQLADPDLARELILRMCEVHGYVPGRGVNYLDGSLFAPGFTLEGCAAYAIAVDRYIRETGDDRIVEENVLADTLYVSSDMLAERRDKTHPLYHTDVTPSGLPAPQPFTLHGNAVVAFALDSLKRTLDEEAAKAVQDPTAVRAAIRRHFVTDTGAKSTFVAASDLRSATTLDDDPASSVLWLPFYEAVERTDSIYRRTVKRIPPGASLAQRLGRLLGPDASSELEWLRRAPLALGVASEFVDADGAATANAGDATVAGLLAYAVWFTVHAHGVR